MCVVHSCRRGYRLPELDIERIQRYERNMGQQEVLYIHHRRTGDSMDHRSQKLIQSIQQLTDNKGGSQLRISSQSPST